MYKNIKKHLKHQENVEMIYVSGENKITKRIVRILNVNEQEIIGYCYLRRNVRTFKVERILAVYPFKDFRSKKTVTS
jgi:predicted DNA-binding transcriptional regulator YafY